MAFFDDFGKRFSEVTSDLSGKAKDFTAQVKLEGEIRKAEGEKRDLFQTIGRLYFEEQTDPGEEKPDYNGLVEKIKGLDSRIRDTKARIEAIKDEAKARAEQRIAERAAAREEAVRRAAEEKLSAEEDGDEAFDTDFIEQDDDPDDVKDGTWTPDGE